MFTYLLQSICSNFTEEILFYENYDLKSVVTPVNYQRLEALLKQTNYCPVKTEFIIQGFKDGFDIGYRGPIEGIKRYSPNLKLNVGSPVVLWNKIMKEVRLKRFAGPFDKVPFDSFIQSPVGLVPKSNEDMRLIFHLSYPRSGDSVTSRFGTAVSNPRPHTEQS